MSNNIFKPNRPDGNQDKQQVPQQAPATSGINIELLDKVAGLLKGIEAMNGKIADNYDIIDEMRDSLKELRDQLRNIKIPEARLDGESREILSSASDTITSGINDINAAVSGAGDTIMRNIVESTNQLSEPLNKLVDDLSTTFKTKIGKAVEKKAEKATSGVTRSMVENWFWRIIFFIGGIFYFVVWLYPKIEDIHFPNGALGILYTVLAILIVSFLFIGTYKWGKANGGGLY